MKPTNEVTALYVDNGLFCELACTLGRTFKKVYYCTPGWTSAFPKPNDAEIGKGLENIEVVGSMFGPWFDKIDVFIFPDVYFGEMQVWLESMGKKVWGSRMGEQLELNRQGCKEVMRRVGLAVGPYVVVKGMAALREHLKANPDRWVKINKYRGCFETFYAKNYKSVEPRLDEVEYKLGAFKTELEFIVETPLDDCIETGIDAYVIDGQYPDTHMVGFEIKDLGYLAKMETRKNIPEQVTRFDNAMAPIFKRYGYRGFFSTEVRIGKDKIPYMIDFCGRLGSPPSELYQEVFTNLADIIWKGANGILVNPIAKAKFGAELLIHSSFAECNYQPIDFPEKYRANVKLRNAMKVNGRYYIIPQSVGLPEVGAIVGWGDTQDAAIEMVLKVAKEVEGHYLTIPFEAFDTAKEEIAKSAKLGIKVF